MMMLQHNKIVLYSDNKQILCEWKSWKQKKIYLNDDIFMKQPVAGKASLVYYTFYKPHKMTKRFVFIQLFLFSLSQYLSSFSVSFVHIWFELNGKYVECICRQRNIITAKNEIYISATTTATNRGNIEHFLFLFF